VNVLLVAPDSKIPNLALMKYSAYYKEKGHDVGFNVTDPEVVIVSVIFSKNRWKVGGMRMMHPDAEFIMGGPGFRPEVQLPRDVEQMQQDYSIYPDYHDSIGRVTIGCPRKCYFCLVPKMGEMRYVQHPKEFYQGGVCRILDDNLMAMPGAWGLTVRWLVENDIEVNFDGLDIRLVDEHIAKDISMLKFHNGNPHFALDSSAYEPEFRRGVELLEGAGVRPSRLMVYIYLHDEKAIPDATKRWGIAREYNTNPFLMVNPENMTSRLRTIRRRGCRPAIWRNLTPEEVFK